MRDIKFRVWDNNLKVLYTPEMDKEEKNLWRISANGGDFTHSYDDGILMQYTGLKDKNGKEIYEGDLIHVEEYYSGDIRIKAYNGVVEFDDGAFCINSIHANEELNEATIYNYQIEIIGNIYKNPELL